MSQIDWKSAPEGATHFGPETDTHCESWYRVEGGKIISFVPTGDYPFVLTKAQAGSGYFHAIDELIEPWTGKGLPPIGLACEGRVQNGGEWKVMTLKYKSLDFSVFELDGEESPIWNPQYWEFRPIRTPEQIADAERKQVIAEMTEIAGGTYAPRDCIVQRLYDAGYRKEAAK